MEVYFFLGRTYSTDPNTAIQFALTSLGSENPGTGDCDYSRRETKISFAIPSSCKIRVSVPEKDFGDIGELVRFLHPEKNTDAHHNPIDSKKSLTFSKK